MKSSMKLFLPASLLALSAVVSGCTAGQAGQQVTAADIVQHMRDTAKTTQTVQGTTDIAVTLNKQGIQTLIDGFMPSSSKGTGAQGSKMDITSKLPDTASAQVKTWKQAANGSTPAKGRIEITSSSLPGVGGLTLVFDGQKAYALDPNRKVLYTGTPEKLMEHVPDQVKAAMRGVDVEKEIDKVLGAADIKLAGTEKVAGLDTYKLDVAPKPDAAEKLGFPKAMQMQAGVLIKDAHLTVWVDKDRWIPLKVVAEHPSIGQFSATTSTIELNKPIDASEFVLQVGSDVKKVDLDARSANMAPATLTLPQARDAASKDGWKLLEASYPADATVVGVTANGSMKQEATGSAAQHPGPDAITVSYSSPATDFTVTQARFEMEKQLGDGFSGMNDRSNATGAVQHITVRGVDAVAFSPQAQGQGAGNWTTLAWKEKASGIYVVVRGKLSLAEAGKIAENLK